MKIIEQSKKPSKILRFFLVKKSIISVITNILRNINNLCKLRLLKNSKKKLLERIMKIRIAYQKSKMK